MATAQWNYADVWEWIADRYGKAPALLHGPTVRTWDDFDRRADGIAAVLLDAGLQRQDKVAQYCRNRPEYLETMFAAFKASLVPVNTNFRYGDEELAYLWTDSDTSAVVFDGEFTDTCDRLRRQLPAIKAWIRVAPPGGDCPAWAIAYDDAAGSGPSSGRTRAPWGRSGDDLNLLYTGGTTGMPKGVMWPQHDFFLMIELQYGRTPPDEADLDLYLSRIEKPGARVLPGPPLMHGTACWFAMAALGAAGSVVTLTKPHFDPVELLDTVVDRQAKGLCIVGDPFAKPILGELDSHPGRWDLAHVRLIMSSGAMLSRESKERLIRHAPRARVVDGLGSSESGSLGTAVTTSPDEAATARFRLSDNVRVVTDDGKDVVAGSGEAGRLAVGGHLPLGYYGDPAKTASTFVTLDGRRYVIAGDWATVDVDGTITLLGRGSGCINTAGEKVYPEEVEEVLKRSGGVRDASVVGVPDDRYGEAVVALVELEPGADFDEAKLIKQAKSHLASYKAPKAVVLVESVARHANGKMDYAAMKERALSQLKGA
ncbi:MAG: AMP-binding protein [Acidimicrobiales bacterium]|jgi:acyl-CoA synthetase (AMP-forming)/AMP-acid ligase II